MRWRPPPLSCYEERGDSLTGLWPSRDIDCEAVTLINGIIIAVNIPHGLESALQPPSGRRTNTGMRHHDSEWLKGCVSTGSWSTCRPVLISVTPHC
jgi:hypothetical protein